MKNLGKILFVFVLVFLLFLVGCKAKKVNKNMIVYGTTESVTDLDPAEAYDFHTWEILYNVYEGLMTYKPGTAELENGLAESYSVNEKGDEYTFKLKEGLKFTDGSAFTAEDVKWSIDRVMRLNGDPAWLVTDFVESVDVVDEYTVRFNLKQPCGFFLKLVATVPYYPVNSNVFPEDKLVTNPSELKGSKLTGLGAYQMVSFKRDEEILLKANPNYFGKTNVDQIVINYFKDPTTMRLAFEKGELDLVYKTLNPSDIRDLLNMEKYNSYKTPGPFIRFLCFETSESVMKDAKARQAVAAMIDRNEICEKVFLNQATPLYSMIPMGMFAHQDSFKNTIGDANIEYANKKLKELGYSKTNPLEFELWYTPSHYGETEVNMAEILKNQIEKSELIKVTPKSAEWSTYLNNFDRKSMGAFLLGWYPDYIDPDNYTAVFAGTTGSASQGIYFSDPQYDRLLKQEKTEVDQQKRKEIFEKLQTLWTEDVPTVPIFQGRLFVFTKKGVTGVKIGTSMTFYYKELKYE
ncbi:MAG: peptide ABC transporter substrate-binding protein [Candidatus Mcinerneyibacterium aminivorans]|uniref:Peptide ABC transporter substrate-binding protein n=1 Tax=Candidatus Mcinerneyibacterium aminivorans TaxID=2703815 RepID=A0A5D0MHZ5_9BACT|nr:MAG: peptide ABC transporter substrate-binding protein [Candidatus Mcinerneyibacterium aminivorans]